MDGFYMWWEIIIWILLLIVGMLLLIKGADWFVGGASNIAKAIGIPALIVGLTLVSIGTSMPELAISVTSSIKGLNDMSFGNVIGSNIFNTYVVIGASAIVSPLIISKMAKRYDIPILMGLYIMVILFAFVVSPNVIEIWEGAIIFSSMFAYLLFLVLRSKEDIKAERKRKKEKKQKWWISLFILLIGLGCIIIGGELVVTNASNIAKRLGMSELFVALTVVSIGTSLPDLVTTLVANRKGEHDIALGNAIGSSIFNIVLILGSCGIIAPISVDFSTLVDVVVMALGALLIFILGFKDNKVTRLEGIFLLLIYLGYLIYIILRTIGMAPDVETLVQLSKIINFKIV